MEIDFRHILHCKASMYSVLVNKHDEKKYALVIYITLDEKSGFSKKNIQYFIQILKRVCLLTPFLQIEITHLPMIPIVH